MDEIRAGNPKRSLRPSRLQHLAGGARPWWSGPSAVPDSLRLVVGSDASRSNRVVTARPSCWSDTSVPSTPGQSLKSEMPTSKPDLCARGISRCVHRRACGSTAGRATTESSLGSHERRSGAGRVGLARLLVHERRSDQGRFRSDDSVTVASGPFDEWVADDHGCGAALAVAGPDEEFGDFLVCGDLAMSWSALWMVLALLPRAEQSALRARSGPARLGPGRAIV